MGGKFPRASFSALGQPKSLETVVRASNVSCHFSNVLKIQLEMYIKKKNRKVSVLKIKFSRILK